MNKPCLADSEIHKRSDGIIEFIRPVLPKKAPVSCAIDSRTTRSLFYGVRQGAVPVGSSAADWRFETHVYPIRGNYFERWVRCEEPGLWSLDQAYLQFYTNLEDLGGRPFFYLHCDPSIPESEKHSEYKKGPHLHLHVPVGHAHIALDLASLPGLLQSVDSVMRGMSRSLSMLKSQLFDEDKVLREVIDGEFFRD